MSVCEVPQKPDELAHFPDDSGYRWLELYDQSGVYAHSAICERDDALELHVTFSRWGPQVRRKVVEDIDWLKSEARRLGKRRIMGVRADSEGIFDPGLFRFARLFGFSELSVMQLAFLRVDERYDNSVL